MTIKVKVVQLGRGVRYCEVSHGSTVEEVLESQQIPLAGMEVRVNSVATGLDMTLDDGDLVTVVPLIKGGTHSIEGTSLILTAEGRRPLVVRRSMRSFGQGRLKDIGPPAMPKAPFLVAHSRRSYPPSFGVMPPMRAVWCLRNGRRRRRQRRGKLGDEHQRSDHTIAGHLEVAWSRIHGDSECGA